MRRECFRVDRTCDVCYPFEQFSARLRFCCHNRASGCLILPGNSQRRYRKYPGTEYIHKVESIVQHPRDSDVDIYLRSPMARKSICHPTTAAPATITAILPPAPRRSLHLLPGPTPDHSRDGALHRHIPSQVPFSSLNGSAANGDWFFSVCDDASGSPGSFIYAKLFLYNLSTPRQPDSSNPTLHGATIDWTGWGYFLDTEFQPLGSAQTGIPNVTGTSSKPYTWTSCYYSLIIRYGYAAIVAAVYPNGSAR